MSPLANLPSKYNVPPLSWVIDQIRSLWIIGPVPPRMDPVANLGNERLRPDLANFTSWLRYLARRRAPMIARLQRALRDVLDGFQSFEFKRQGAGRFALTFLFKGRTRSAKPVSFTFDELSEGQRALVVLHALLHHAPGQGGTLCIDEPESYLALPEIQPWLSELTVQAEDGGRQVLLISHHPQLINFLAADSGIWLERPPVGAVRARPITRDHSGLDPAELIARGWLDG